MKVLKKMNTFKVNTEELKKRSFEFSVADKLLLSGTVYTARDAAHKRIFELLNNGEKLPFNINNAVIYYAGPTPTPPNLKIGSCGPTTSKRMDPYTPTLLNMGLAAIIGKGERNEETTEAFVKNGAVYLCAIGGCGALAAKCITDCEVIAFDDLGCESVKKLTLKDFPVTVAIDTKGNSIYKR